MRLSYHHTIYATLALAAFAITTVSGLVATPVKLPDEDATSTAAGLSKRKQAVPTDANGKLVYFCGLPLRPCPPMLKARGQNDPPMLKARGQNDPPAVVEGGKGSKKKPGMPESAEGSLWDVLQGLNKKEETVTKS